MRVPPVFVHVCAGIYTNYMCIYIYIQAHLHRPVSPCTRADTGIHACFPVRIDGTSLLSDLFLLCRWASWSGVESECSTVVHR